MFRRAVTCCLIALSPVAARSATLQAPEGNIRLDAIPGNPFSEVISVRIGNDWVPALSAQQSATRVVISGHPADSHLCIINSVSTIPDGELLSGDCGVGSFEEHILLSSEPDVLNVSMQFTVNPGVEIVSVEDRYDFAPGRRLADSPLGPIDFVWSQNIKNEADGDIPNWSFKSPAVMLQQGRVFTALMPTLSDRRSDPLALDLDVTSNPLPWLAYGAISSQPYGHSYFRRSTFGSPRIIQAASQSGDRGHIEYQYSIVASDQPYKLGYRSVVRRLWSDEGHAALLRSSDLQQNVLRPQLATFEDWASDTWIRYANQVYVGFDCGQRRCGTLASFRNPWGHWDQSAPDAWFNPWFETLRTAYGWYLYGSRTNNKDIQAKSESVLNLALSSPRDGGAFSTIYLVNNRSWVHSDGWAGFSDDYHAFAMSWTAYWMLKWAEDLDPGREQEVLEFTRPYGDFLIQHQLPNGNIPAWFDSQMKPREEFRDFNAETAASALFLAQLYQHTRNQAYLDAARKAMDFITREVLPRQRWFDYETFLSCARKPFSFYDPWTAQYPQNNLSQIQAAEAYLKLFQITNDPKYLSTGTHVLDYLLLTQQVWNNPALSPKMVGGFTTQNTDAEWSDAREAYAAVLLWRYYQATGTAEYLERAVAAARSIFAVAPWENWAHTGYIDESGSLTGFNWGAGSGMASVEMMFPKLGDAFVDLKNRSAVGFNACSIRNLRIENNTISFDLDVFADKLPTKRTIAVRFADIDKDAQYRIIWNEHPSGLIAGATLIADGFTIRESK